MPRDYLYLESADRHLRCCFVRWLNRLGDTTWLLLIIQALRAREDIDGFCGQKRFSFPVTTRNATYLRGKLIILGDIPSHYCVQFRKTLAHRKSWTVQLALSKLR